MKLIKLMQGWGDSVYQRPFIKTLAKTEELYLETPLPEMFSDIENIKFVKTYTELRTQGKNQGLTKILQVDKPKVSYKDTLEIHYGHDDLPSSTIMACLEAKFKCKPGVFDLPPTPAHGLSLPNKPVAIIRPPTVRKEWPVVTRAPEPSYINWCAHFLRELGYFTIVVADVDGTNEVLLAPPPKADLHLLKGELSMWQTLDLVKESSVMVSGSGWPVPVGMAAGVPTFIVFGGRGRFDSPIRVFDHRIEGAKYIGYAVPPKQCRCGENVHDCDKAIPNLEERFFDFLQRTSS